MRSVLSIQDKSVGARVNVAAVVTSFIAEAVR